MDLTTIVLDLLRNREIMLSEGAWSAVAQAQHELIGNHFLSARQMIDEIDSFDSDLQSYAAMMIATRASCFLGDLGRAEQQVEQLGKHPMLGDSLALAAANYRIGLFMRLATRFDEALSCQVQAQGQFRVLGWKLEEAFCSIEIGSIMLERGDATGAIQSYLMATDVIREEAGEDAYASLLANHATALTHAGNLEMARSLYEEALSIGAFLKPSVSRAWLLQNLATVVKRQMLFDRAEKLYYEALSCIDAEDSASLYHKLKCSLVDLMIQREDDQGAETLLHELSGVDEGSVRIQTRVEILSNQAHLLYRKGEWQQALDHLRRSIDLAKAHELHDIHLALLTDALEWIDRSDLRMELLEEHRMMQNQRIDSLKRGVDHILSMRSYYEEEKARLEVVRQQELARTIVDTQATMMSQIGRDLHDSIGQDLTVLSRLVERLAKGPLILQPEYSSIISTMLEVSRRASADTRRIAHLLSSGNLSGKGLADAVTNIRNEVQKACPELDIQLYFSDRLDDMPHLMASASYRIIQTLIQNIIQHAKARRCSINIVAHDDHYHIAVEDDGVGFDLTKRADGLGLKEMRARVELLDGAFRIESALGAGTYAEITLRRKQRAE